MTLRAMLDEKKKIFDLEQTINQLEIDLENKLIEALTSSDETVKNAAIVQVRALRTQITQHKNNMQKIATEVDEIIVNYVEKEFETIRINFLNSKTILFNAVETDNLERLDAILKLGVDTSQINEAGDTALHIAAKKPLTKTNQSIINLILQYSPDAFAAVNKAGNSVIEEAAMTSEWSKLDWLDNKGKGIIKDTSRRETLDKLYRVASTQNKQKLANKQLHEGAKQNDLAAIEKALEEGADINDRSYGATALYNAVDYEYTQCVAYLLEKGADQKLSYGDQIPYDISVQKDPSLKLILANKMLITGVLDNEIIGVASALAKNADINDATYTDKQTALHVASAAGYFDIVKLLIDSQANIFKADINGQIPLHKAALNGNEAVLQCLIEQHVKEKPDQFLHKIEDANKQTPVQLASQSRNPELQHMMPLWFGLFNNINNPNASKILESSLTSSANKPI